MAAVFETPNDMLGTEGQTLGTSEWMEIDQDRPHETKKKWYEQIPQPPPKNAERKYLHTVEGLIIASKRNMDLYAF